MSIPEGIWAALDSSGFSIRNEGFTPKLQDAWRGFGLEAFAFLLFASVLDFCGFVLGSLVLPRPTSGHLQEKYLLLCHSKLAQFANAGVMWAGNPSPP